VRTGHPDKEGKEEKRK